MLYNGFQALTDLLLPARTAAATALWLRDEYFPGLDDWPVPRYMLALCEVVGASAITHSRPSFGISEVLCGNALVTVREEVVLDLPFGKLLHFAKDDVATPQPRMLVVAPLSGHFATLLADTVATLLCDHDVYITDWTNARDVPQSAGRFGLEDYTDYVIRFLQYLGPRSHLLAVCQPCVPALTAVSVMAQDHDPCQPLTMTLMGGPIDVRASPTAVNELANEHPLEWFKDNLISRVPARFPGAGREVYPGFLQLTAFIAMNPKRHASQLRNLVQTRGARDDVAADKIHEFYKEYMAVLDLTAEFYLETVDMVFQRALLAKGELVHRGRLVDPGAIHQTALLTVEGERDDICAVGQTAAAHLLCSGLRPHLKRHHLQPGVGHYGVFSGSKWEKQVYPQVRAMVLAMS
ncbi:MAG: polyhydroxyalkanoate depolymerase [Pseudomonadota bacterium]|nr:polyhydroxyalkanoate depolymerase [Pseudomonadota bacterium]